MFALLWHKINHYTRDVSGEPFWNILTKYRGIPISRRTS